MKLTTFNFLDLDQKQFILDKIPICVFDKTAFYMCFDKINCHGREITGVIGQIKLVAMELDYNPKR